MKLYLTGASDFESSQPDYNLSVGGEISGTEFNPTKDRLFPPIIQNDLINGKQDLRVLAIKNDGADPIDVSVYYNNKSANPVSYLKMELASVTADNCSGYTTPTTPTDLEDCRGEENKLTPVTIGVGLYKTLFIQRNISKSLGLAYLDCSEMYNRFIAEDKLQSSILTFNTNPTSGQYILLYTPSNTYCIYYGTDKPTTVIANEFIKVTIGIDTATTILNTYNKLLTTLIERGDITSEYDSTTLTLTQTQFGLLNGPVASFATIETTDGSTSSIEETEDIELVIEY